MAPSLYRTYYWCQDYIEIKGGIDAGLSTDYVYYYVQKGKDSTGVFRRTILQ